MFNIAIIIIASLSLFWLIYTSFQIFKLKQELTNLEVEQLKCFSDFTVNLSQSLQYVMNTTHFNSVALRHTLNALRPYIVSLMNNASSREDFKEAQICKDMIKEMDEIIKTPL